MSRILVTVMLLLSGLVSHAAAEEGPKDATHNKAQKLQAYLELVGLNHPRIVKLTQTVGERMEGKYLRIAEERFDSGRVVLHYAARPKISSRQLELKFQPTASPHTEIVATTRSVMFHYQYRF